MEKTKMFTLARRIVGNLFKKPATIQYPFEPVEFPERMRGHISIRIVRESLSVPGDPGGPKGRYMDHQPI